MASKSDINELKEECRELKKRNAYLEDEEAYIKTLMEGMLKDKSEDINLQRKIHSNKGTYIRSSITSY